MSIGVMLFNPFTGQPRHPSDIESDPRGVLIWDGEEPLRAASVATPPLPVQEPVAFDAFLESEDFYELMQAYRHFPIDALVKFEAVKDALRTAHNIKERNFCPRCGKRTNDIHTCTPPQ